MPAPHAIESTLTSAVAQALFDTGLTVAAAVVEGRVKVASPGLSDLLSRDQLAGSDFIDIFPAKDRHHAQSLLETSNDLRTPRTIITNLERSNGTLVPIEMKCVGTVIDGEDAILVSITDLTESVAAEQRLRAIAHFDPLTDLPNRLLLQDRLSQGLAAAKRKRRLLGLMVVDLDEFKAVNDEHGHAAGDGVLREVAYRFSGCIRNADTLARVGGDEFVVVLPELEHREGAAIIAARLVNALRPPIVLGSVLAHVGASIGIAIYPDDGTDIDMLFARADSAMYTAKRAGKNQYGFADVSASVVLSTERPEWSDKWCLGIPEMDADHEMLFNLLNDLAIQLAADSDEGEIQMRVRNLVDFCARHFAEEERIMRAAHFDGLEGHRAEHKRLLVDLAELAEHTHWVGASLTLRHLRNWLIGHMLSYDRAAAAGILRSA